MDDLSYMSGTRLSAIQFESNSELLRVDYSIDEREGTLLYRFHLPGDIDAKAGVLPIVAIGYIEEGAPTIRNVEWSELPARVPREALEWLHEQHVIAKAASQFAVVERIRSHIGAFERIAA